MDRDRLILKGTEIYSNIDLLPSLCRLVLPKGAVRSEDLKKELEAFGCAISPGANELLSAIPASDRALDEEVELVVVSAKALGFDSYDSYKLRRDPAAQYVHIREIASSLGLRSCPPEVGPLLRKVLLNQLWGREICIAMEPLKMERGGTGIFVLVSLYDLSNILTLKPRPWLIAKNCSNESRCAPHDQFAFIRPRKKD